MDLIKGRAVVKSIINSGQLSKEESEAMVSKNQQNLFLDKNMLKRFAGKRYLVLITIDNFCDLVPFKIDRSRYGNMDDWLLVGSIESVVSKS